MVRIARIIGMTLVAMLAVSGVASAHSFVAEKAGPVTRVANATQVFKTGALTTVECTVDAVSNANAVAGKQLHLLADVSYSGCKAAGVAATVSTAKYLFSADELAKLENTITITATEGCIITVKPQHFATGIKYKNSGKDVVVEPNVTGIASEGVGGPFGLCAGKSTTGTYTGTTQVDSTGQTIKWE